MWGKNNENSIVWKCEMFSFRFYCKALPDYYLRRNLLLFLNANLPLDALCPFVPVLSLSITIERFLAGIYSWNIFSQTDWYLSDLLCQVKKKTKQTNSLLCDFIILFLTSQNQLSFHDHLKCPSFYLLELNLSFIVHQLWVAHSLHKNMPATLPLT